MQEDGNKDYSNIFLPLFPSELLQKLAKKERNSSSSNSGLSFPTIFSYLEEVEEYVPFSMSLFLLKWGILLLLLEEKNEVSHLHHTKHRNAS